MASTSAAPSADNDVDKLKELGIDHETAVFALEKQKGDVERAAEYALSGAAQQAEASRLILNALERTQSAQSPKPTTSSGGSFAKMSLSSMMGGLSSLSLTRDKGEDRGRKEKKEKDKADSRSSSVAKESESRGRSQSPFRRRGASRTRERSPSVEALRQSQSDVESDAEGTSRRIRPRNAFSQAADGSASGSDDDDEDDDASEESSWSDNDAFDVETEENTEKNALLTSGPIDEGELHDPLGEGVNVVRPPEPFFPSTLQGRQSTRRKKSMRHHETLPLVTSRPQFNRDRCTITLTHGNPTESLAGNGRRARRYVVASDLSEESKYAVEWGIGTVLRDGDEMILVTVQETESKLDPSDPATVDRIAKLRNQQERQTLAYLLVRQVTGLLQRTKLHVTVMCQALHAKNSRHTLLDLIDFVEPTMVIVGSRGRGQIKGILLGSTSHYLIQKSSCPVMVARRRLKRPARRTAHLSASHPSRVPLAQAAIDKVGTGKVEKDVLEGDDVDDDKKGTIKVAADESDDEEDERTDVKVAGQ